MIEGKEIERLLIVSDMNDGGGVCDSLECS